MSNLELAARQNERRVCTRCSREKPLSEFARSKSRGQLYVRNWCEVCLLVYHRTHKRQAKVEVA